MGRAADYGGGASGSFGVKDYSNRSQNSAAPTSVMADEALVVRGALQDPGPVKISSTQLLALSLALTLSLKKRHQVRVRPVSIRVDVVHDRLQGVAAFAVEGALVALDHRSGDRLGRLVRLQVPHAQAEDILVVRRVLGSDFFEAGASDELYGRVRGLAEEANGTGRFVHPGVEWSGKEALVDEGSK